MCLPASSAVNPNTQKSSKSGGTNSWPHTCYEGLTWTVKLSPKPQADPPFPVTVDGWQWVAFCVSAFGRVRSAADIRGTNGSLP
jgi:hypothetical protein